MMNDNLLIIFLVCCFVKIDAEIFGKCTRLECSPVSQKYIHNHTCTLKHINKQRTLANLSVFFKKNVNKAYVNIVLYVRNKGNIYTPFIINVTEDVCRLVDYRTGGVLTLAVLKALDKTSNFNHSCPYSNVIVKDFYFDLKFLPVKAMPRKSYKAVLKFYEGSEYLGWIAYYMDLLGK